MLFSLSISPIVVLTIFCFLIGQQIDFHLTQVPIELMDGYIGQLSVSVPWSNLLNDNCQFVIDGLTVTLQVKKRANPAQVCTENLLLT